jgi:hypothetical protein
MDRICGIKPRNKAQVLRKIKALIHCRRGKEEEEWYISVE